MSDDMWALVFDRSKDEWEKVGGCARCESKSRFSMKKPARRRARRYKGSLLRCVRVGQGDLDRNAFKDMIYDSLDEERKDVRITGHELLGQVVDAGSLADKHYGFRAGDIVTTESHITCGKCLQCRIGQREVCQDELIIGFSLDGCFAEYIKLPAEVLWKSDPKKIRKEVGAIQEPFGNAVHACTKVDLRGKSLAIFGCGTIGMFTDSNRQSAGRIKDHRHRTQRRQRRARRTDWCRQGRAFQTKR